MPRRGDKMKKFFTKVWKVLLFVAKVILFAAEVVAGAFFLSGLELAENGLEMIWQLLSSAITGNREKIIAVQNGFRYENLVRTDFVSMLVQGLILVLLAKLAYKLLKKYFKRKWSVE
jgi:hypothetical protein